MYNAFDIVQVAAYECVVKFEWDISPHTLYTQLEI